MSRKKDTSTSLLSPEEQDRVQRLIDHYHETARELRATTEQSQAEAVLEPISGQSEAVQMGLLGALSREHTQDAADILVAINALSPSKEVRKEARRALIRLESSKIQPQWMPPIVRASVIQVNIAHPPRFWRGVVTQSREEGEIQLVLGWEQGYDYTEARVLIFLLDFWEAGVKEIIVDVYSKKQFENRIEEMRARLTESPLTDCTLAEGRRLLQEALSVNQWRKTQLPKEYRVDQSLINQLILEAQDAGEDRGKTFIHPDLEDQETLIYFLGAWSMGDYGLAYDLQSEQSSLKEGLDCWEWIERRRAWADEAHPARMELGFVREREASQGALWVPTPAFGRRASMRHEIEIGWSLELSDTPLSGTLREMPMGTAINKETGRHWFWTSYMLNKEDAGWRIQSMTDQGASVQGLSIEELQRRIQEYEKAIEEKVQQRNQSNIDATMEELSWRFTQLLHFYDGLIARLPLDRKVSEDAYTRSLAVGNPERTVVYVERLAFRFPEQHAEMLRRLGATLVALAFRYDPQHMGERRAHLLERAEAIIRESLTADNSAMGHILLGELLLSQDRNDEAEAELQQAKQLTPAREEETSLEMGLGNIAMRQERIADAVPHFQRVSELDPNYPGVWFNLGFAQRLVGNLEQAERAYQRALQIEPEDVRPYTELVAIYMNQDLQASAQKTAEQGVQNNPDSAELHALLASVLFERGNVREAQRELEEAEEIDPDLEVVRNVRQYMSRNALKKR